MTDWYIPTDERNPMQPRLVTIFLATLTVAAIVGALVTQAASARTFKCRADSAACIHSGDRVGRGTGHLPGPPVSIFPPHV